MMCQCNLTEPSTSINNMARSAVYRVAYFALYSRILVFVMQIFFNYLMPDHDVGDVFNPPNVHRVGRLDWWMHILFDGFRRWDSIYFLHIAEHGYTYENTLAFCPLYPILVRFLSNSLFLPLHYFLNYSTVLLITAVLLNVYFFVKSAKALYLLSERVLGDETLALKTAQLYCINPASIFFSAAYSEASFAFLTFSGLLEYEKRNFSRASLFFGFSTLARSNGMVNAGFILYRKFVDLIETFRSTKWSEFADLKSSIHGFIWSVFFITIGPTLFYLILCLAPFAAYQAYAYSIFCNKDASYKNLPNHILNYGNNQNYKMPHGGLSPWCHRIVPLSYSYVQNSHWNNGFLQYYQLKQIPNFLLAAPMVILCTCALVGWARHNVQKAIASGGLQREEYYKKYDEERTEGIAGDRGFYSTQVFVYVVHILGLLTTAVLFMHIQVVTRFIACASPVIYWFVATATTPTDQLRPKTNSYDVFKKPAPPPPASNGEAVRASKSPLDLDIVDWDKTNMASKAVFIYFHLYFFVGVAAFSNFLPWT